MIASERLSIIFVIDSSNCCVSLAFLFLATRLVILPFLTSLPNSLRAALKLSKRCTLLVDCLVKSFKSLRCGSSKTSSISLSCLGVSLSTLRIPKIFLTSSALVALLISSAVKCFPNLLLYPVISFLAKGSTATVKRPPAPITKINISVSTSPLRAYSCKANSPPDTPAPSAISGVLPAIALVTLAVLDVFSPATAVFKINPALAALVQGITKVTGSTNAVLTLPASTEPSLSYLPLANSG